MLQLLSLALGLLASLHLAAAACTQPRQRVEWYASDPVLHSTWS